MHRAQAPALALLLAACAWLPACGLNQGGVEPPKDTIAYPASAVMDRYGNWLFVTNSNADLRYNDGTVMALSLALAEDDRKRANTQGACEAVNYSNPRSDTPFCCHDALDPNILNCDERAYVVGPDGVIGNGNGNVRIGSFAAGMVLQKPVCPRDFDTDPSGSTPCGVCMDLDTAANPDVDDRLLIGVRGDTSLTFVDVKSQTDNGVPRTDLPPLMKCVTGADGPEPSTDFASCDAAHRIIRAESAIATISDDPDPPDIALPDEPYALAVDPAHGLLFIGHLTGNTTRPYTGGFSLFDVAPGGSGPLDEPRFIAPFPSPFPPNSLGAIGVSAVKYTNGFVYASSRYIPQVVRLGSTATCAPPNTPDATPIRDIVAYPDGTTYSTPLSGGETRGIEFVSPDRSFVLQRNPPALIGFLGTTPTDVLETCGSPTFLSKYPDPDIPGVSPRLFVTCFADGEVYVFDPAVPRLVKTFVVGRGPSGLVFDAARQVAYVVGFGDNNISVIDLAPGSRTEYHVIQRIGFPRTSPR
jgi:hypothetical protein